MGDLFLIQLLGGGTLCESNFKVVGFGLLLHCVRKTKFF